MASGKYLEKAIESQTGFAPMCWRCKLVRILVEDKGVIVHLGLDGWKDAASCAEGKAPESSKTVTIENAEELPEYQQVFSTFLARILGDPQFENAKLMDLPG